MKNEEAEKLIHLIANNGVDTKQSYTHPIKTNNKSFRISLGRQLFNVLLPDDFEFINETVNKKKLTEIIQRISEQYDAEKVSQIVGGIQYYAFRLSALLPSSFNINGLTPPPEWTRKKDDFLANPPDDMHEYQAQVKALTQELIEFIEASGMEVQNILMGGIEGDPIGDWGAMLVSKGYVVDIENNVLGPINHGINDGYDPDEFYQAAAEARRGFYYKSSVVQDPGYMSRKIAMACAKVKIDSSVTDCKTTRYFSLFINEQTAPRVKNRYHNINNEIQLIQDTKSLIGSTIQLRSPLYCKATNGICSICYGKTYEQLNTKQIGILASGAVNNVSINAYMKLRHKSSQVEVIDVDFQTLIEKSKLDRALISQTLQIEKNKIIANDTLRINIDKNDYDEKSLSDAGNTFILPGMIDIMHGEHPNIDFIHLPFNFKVNLFKPENIIIDGKMIYLTYEAGEVIIEQDKYVKEVDPTVISKLFEARAKYINDPEMLVFALWEQMPNLDIIHLETIVQNMFRDKNDLANLARLNDYRNFEILSQKKLPFVDSWLNSMAFEDINKAISGGLLHEKTIQNDPYENLIIEKFDTEEGE